MLMLSSILQQSLKTIQNNAICDKYIQSNNVIYSYCQKANYLINSQLSGSNQLILSQQSNSIFVYTEAVKESNINVKLGRTNVFAVFGFELDNQEISSSTINVTIDFSIVTGALVCLQCNLSVDSSTLVFSASGQKLSGIMTTAGLFFQVSKSLLQFRLNGLYQSGLVNSIQREMAAFALQDSRMTCYFYNDGDQTGNLVAEVGAKTVLLASGFSICSNGIKDVAFASDPAFWAVSGSIGQNCLTICESGFVTYGLCLMDLLNGVQINGQASCQNNFEFDGKDCVCEAGYVLNGTVCLNLINLLGSASTQINLLKNITDNASAKFQSSLAQNMIDLEVSLKANVQNLNETIKSSNATFFQNLTQIDMKTQAILKNNLITLQNRIIGNASAIQAQMLSQFNVLNASVAPMKTTLQNTISSLFTNQSAQIKGNITIINTNITTATSEAATNLSNARDVITDRITTAKTTMDKYIAQLKCAKGDCQHKSRYTLPEDTHASIYCSYSSGEADDVCNKYYKDEGYTVTVPNTCYTQLDDNVAGRYNIEVLCCKPLMYWNWDTNTCDIVK
ncbi:Growth_factor receptor cysteine-rich domain superfamily [Hexamita inflata]|uniref:Growth factor receptor cysteine-rich domain superfamily n=1 Tax=Hexamita inflata TaxID=28002 RepID=A0AA86RGE5_9EUKA|nr:Growth factor receptor cysteine-rich domain superfamily [Hexamita inflata]